MSRGGLVVKPPFICRSLHIHFNIRSKLYQRYLLKIAVNSHPNHLIIEKKKMVSNRPHDTGACTIIPRGEMWKETWTYGLVLSTTDAQWTINTSSYRNMCNPDGLQINILKHTSVVSFLTSIVDRCRFISNSYVIWVLCFTEILLYVLIVCWP